MRDDEWTEAYNAGRREDSKGLVEALDEIISRDRPTYGQGDFCEGSEGAWSDAADIARAALAKYREGRA